MSNTELVVSDSALIFVSFVCVINNQSFQVRVSLFSNDVHLDLEDKGELMNIISSIRQTLLVID